MKQRILVMNGQRIVQSEREGAWSNDQVTKAGALKAGLYNIYMAKDPDKSKSYQGTIIHADDSGIYQQVGKQYVVHAPSDFDIVPGVGTTKSIGYGQDGKAQVEAMTAQQVRGRSR